MDPKGGDPKTMGEEAEKARLMESGFAPLEQESGKETFRSKWTCEWSCKDCLIWLFFTVTLAAAGCGLYEALTFHPEPFVRQRTAFVIVWASRSLSLSIITSLIVQHWSLCGIVCDVACNIHTCKLSLARSICLGIWGVPLRLTRPCVVCCWSPCIYMDQKLSCQAHGLIAVMPMFYSSHVALKQVHGVAQIL